MKNQEHHNALGVILQVRAMGIWTSRPEGAASPISIFPTWRGASFTQQCPPFSLEPSFPSHPYHFMLISSSSPQALPLKSAPIASLGYQSVWPSHAPCLEWGIWSLLGRPPLTLRWPGLPTSPRSLPAPPAGCLQPWSCVTSPCLRTRGRGGQPPQTCPTQTTSWDSSCSCLKVRVDGCPGSCQQHG